MNRAAWRMCWAAAACLSVASAAWAVSGRGLAVGRAFSYAWNNPQQQPWDNPLQTSMYDAGPYPGSGDWFGRPGRNTTLSSPMSMSLTPAFAPTMDPMGVSATPSSGAMLAPMKLINIGPVRKAVSMLAKEDKTDEPLTGEWLTSLAPDGPGAVRLPMIQAQEEFRAGKYQEASEDFEAARKASMDSPESLLSLAQVYFAMGEKYYAQSADCLAKAIKAFPDLPLVRVRPADFFGSPDAYNKAYAALEGYAKANPRDAQALFLLGYVQWRQGQVDAAFASLDAASAASPSTDLVSAIALLNHGIGQAKAAVLAKAPPLAPPTDYPWVGVKLALPQGFAANPLTSLNRVLAGMVGGADDAQLITLNAYPVTDSVALSAFMDSIIASMRKAHFVTDLTIEAELEIPFGVDKALVRVLSYSPASGGERISAAWFGFVREPKDGKGQSVACLLGVAGADKQADLHLATLAAIAKSLVLSEPASPSIPPLNTGSVIEDAKRQFSIVQPAGWEAQANEKGYELGQMDLADQKLSPKAEIVVQTILGSYTPKSFGEEFIARQAKAGTAWEVLSQGPVKLSDQDGYQFVLRQAADSSAGGDIILVGRLICLPGPDGQKTLYAVVVERRAKDAKTVEAMADSLAAGFKLLPAASK